MLKNPTFFKKQSVLGALPTLLGWALLPTAAAAQVFCVTPVASTPCAGRQVGDLLIVDHANQAVLGLNPTNGYYLFSDALDPNGPHPADELTSIVQNPVNPLHPLVIGVIGGLEAGIAQLDDCGNDLTPLFDNFVPSSSVFNIGGIIDRDMAIDPLNGNLYSPSSPGIPFGNPPNVAITNGIYIFPPGGGNSTFVTVGGDFVNAAIQGVCAFDEFGDLFTADGNMVVQYTAATLASTPPMGAFLHGPENALSNITGMVYDGNGNLFLAGTDASNHGGVWKTNIATGTTTLFCSGFGSVSPGGFFNVPFGITIDFNGDLWMVITNNPTFSSAGVVKISGTTGQALQFFLLPNTVGGIGFGSSTEIQGISVLGMALPVHKCPPTATPTPCVPSIVSPNLDLKIKRIQCSPNQVVYRVFVQNNSPSPVKLSDLTVKLWAFDTGITNWQLGSYFSGLLFGNGVNGQTANGGFVLNAKPFTPACTTDPTHQANWEFDVSHTSTLSVPANGGSFIAGDFGIFPAGFSPNFNPGLSSWFSQAPGGACGDTGSSNDPSTYFDDPHYALFFQGSLVAERGGTDPNTGTIPCTFICPSGVVAQGTLTPTATLTPTPTPCNASPSIVSPNLDLKVRMIQCNTDDQAVLRVFVRNNDPSVQVRLSDLTMKIWTFDTTATGWSLSNYFNGNLFTASGNPSTGVTSPFALSAQAIPLCNLNPNHFANWELDITNNSSQLIPNNGGYFIDGDFGIKRSDAGAFVPGISQWYSQIPLGEGSTCSDTAGNNPSGYFDDAHYDLFYQGHLVAERAGTDPQTGLRPCFCGAPMGSALPQKGGPDEASVAGSTPTPTVSPTPVAARGWSVTAAPNVSTGGEPIRFLVNLEQPAQARLSLFTLTGEQVYATTLSGGTGENTLSWNLQNQTGSAVASGLYLYEVDINDPASPSGLRGAGGTGDIRKTGKVAVIH